MPGYICPTALRRSLAHRQVAADVGGDLATGMLAMLADPATVHHHVAIAN
jgi:hypothetical protein